MNEQILTQINNGLRTNPFITHCKSSRPAPLSSRTQQVLNFMRSLQREVEPPKSTARNLAKVDEYSISRQARYFGAWANDQWEHAEMLLKNKGLDERVIKTYHDEFISLLHEDFETGVAREYADDWYRSFPNGGFFNPIRYTNLYPDEFPIAHRVEEYMQCGETHPSIAGILNYPKPAEYDHRFVKNGGAYIVSYPVDSKVNEMLKSQIMDMDRRVSEAIVEDESTKHGQRIFISDSYDHGDTIATCAILYSGFDTDYTYLLMNSMKNAIIEAIPVDEWRDKRVSIKTSPFSVTYGEMEIAKAHLKMDPSIQSCYAVTNIPTTQQEEPKLDESLLPNKDVIDASENYTFV